MHSTEIPEPSGGFFRDDNGNPVFQPGKDYRNVQDCPSKDGVYDLATVTGTESKTTVAKNLIDFLVFWLAISIFVNRESFWEFVRNNGIVPVNWLYYIGVVLLGIYILGFIGGLFKRSVFILTPSRRIKLGKLSRKQYSDFEQAISRAKYGDAQI